MGRPTLAAQIAKAAAEGDMEKVKELAVRLEKNDVKKPKVKTKPAVKAKKQKIKVYEENLYIPEDPYENEEDEREQPPGIQTDFIVAAKSKNHQQMYIDENGDEKVRAKVVPFKVVKNRKNNWEDDKELEAADIEFDKLVHKNGSPKRQYRPPTTKVKVRCSRCNDAKLVWPGEVKHSNWACDSCLTRNKPR